MSSPHPAMLAQGTAQLQQLCVSRAHSSPEVWSPRMCQSQDRHPLLQLPTKLQPCTLAALKYESRMALTHM